MKKIDFTRLDKICITANWILLLIIWLITIVIYENLPNRIPTHFNFSGMAVHLGNKIEIFALPVLVTLITIGLSWLNKLIMVKNGASNNLITTYRIINFYRVAIPLIFGIIIFHIYKTVNNHNDGLGYWLSTYIILIINIPNIYYLTKYLKSKITDS